jgi:putative hydrolase of the HAD superfamily
MIPKRIIADCIRPMDPIPTGMRASGRRRGPIRCLLFDIYGTLFISASGDIGTLMQQPHSHRRLTRLLDRYAIDRSPETVIADYVAAIKEAHERRRRAGVDVPEVDIRRIWPKVLEVEDAPAIREFAVTFELIVNPVYPMPGTARLIDSCRTQPVLTGLVSNAQFYTPYLFTFFFDAEPQGLGFDAELLIYSYRFQAAKPSKMLFDAAIGRLTRRGIAPAEVLYIGNDMLNDIFPARRAGFQTALFAGDARSLRLRQDRPECSDLKPDFIVTELLQLLDFVSVDPPPRSR